MRSSESRPPGADPAPERIRAMLEESARVKQALAQEAPRIARAAALLAGALGRGGKALLFGNGGSAADAQHIAAEWTGRLRDDRRAFPAIALGTSSAELTALGNDYGFEHVFARLVAAHGVAGDLALGISTSGNSENVLRGLDEARERGLATVALTGASGGKLHGRADVVIGVPSDDTPRIQEGHIALLHAMCEEAERALFPERAAE